MLLTNPPIESEWHSVLFSCITSLPFPDPRSRMFRTMPLIEKWVKITWRSPRLNLLLSQIDGRQWSAHSRRSKVSAIHLSVFSRKSLSFLDPWSTIFCTFWLMERRIGSPLLSTKLSSGSPTMEVPSTANIRQSSNMFRTCLSSSRVAPNRSAPYLRKWYDNFDVIVCSFCFWCCELLKARKTIIFEPFIQWKKRLKGVQAFATDSEPFKGWSDWWTIQNTVWNTFCCQFSHISEKVFAEVFATFHKRGQGFVSSCTFWTVFFVPHATFFLQCTPLPIWVRLIHGRSVWIAKNVSTKSHSPSHNQSSSIRCPIWHWYGSPRHIQYWENDDLSSTCISESHKLSQ